MRKKHFDLRIPTLIDTLINMIYKCFDFVLKGSRSFAYVNLPTVVAWLWKISEFCSLYKYNYYCLQTSTNIFIFRLSKIYHTNSIFLLRIAFRHTKNLKFNQMWSCHVYICKKSIFKCIFWFLYKEMLECTKKNIDGNALWLGV